MADEAKGDEAEGGPAAVEIRDLDWDCRLTKMERVESDPEDEDGIEDLFALTFAVDGPNANAEVEIMVADADDVEAVAVGLATLRVALMAWADLIWRRQAEAREIMPTGD